MDNSEKKYDSLGCILAAAMLSAFINKDFSTSDTEPDKSIEKPVNDNNTTCNGNCKNNCKSCSESKVKLDMELIKSKYEEVKNYFILSKNPATLKMMDYWLYMAYISFMELGESLGIEKGE